MEKILIATGNAHKVSEFSSILRNLGADVELVSPKDLGDDSEPVENGDSYAENSRIKASYYYEKYHMPTIADDSGIEIDFYDGEPGIYSARFLPEMNYKEKNEYITSQMKGSRNRGASFHCVVTFIKDGITKQYEGILYGKIAECPSGSEGFGYDPIFIPEGHDRTNADLGQEFKDGHSHRALALKKWVEDNES